MPTVPTVRTLYITKDRIEILRMLLDAGEGSITAWDVIEKHDVNYGATCISLRRMVQHGWAVAVRAPWPYMKLQYTLTPKGRTEARYLCEESS